MSDAPKHVRVLILEDNLSDAELLVLELRRAHFDPDWKLVTTEQDYLARLDPGLDIILSDYSMPGFSGFQALHLLGERGLDIPFIIISSTAGEDIAVAAMQEGAADYLLKDRLDRLGPAVTRAMEKRRLLNERGKIDRQLHRTEKQLANILEYAAESILALNQEDEIIAFNKAAENMFGFSAQEALGKPLDLLIPDRLVKNHREHVQHFAAVADLSRPLEHRPELVAKRKDGSEFPVEIGLSKLQADDGIIFTAMIVDITERKRTEDQNKYHARLLRHINDAVIATDDRFRITTWNRAAERIYGWTSAEVIGRNIDEILSFGLSEQQQAAAKELLGEQSSSHSERIHSKKNGQLVYVEENAIALTDPHGKPTGYVSVNRDITERKQAEAELKEKERLLSESQRIGNVGSWSYNLLTNELQFSEEMYRLLDISPGEFPHSSETFLELIYPLDHSAAAQWMDDIRSGRQPAELNFRIFHKNGELRYLQCRGAIVFESAGKPVRFIGMAQDITERRLAEIQIRQQIEQLSALRRIDQTITSNFDLYVSLNVLLSELRTQLQVDAADILLLNPDGRMLNYFAGNGFRTHTIETARVSKDSSHAGRAAKERRLIKIENLKDQPPDYLLTMLLAEEDFVCYYAVPIIASGKVKGVLEIFHRVLLHPYPEWLNFLETLAGQAAIAIENATLFENLQTTNQELSQAYDATIEGWARALDLRDKETEGHSRRVADYSLRLARAMRVNESELEHFKRGALLHDIGKLGIPDRILLKPGPLSDEEWDMIRNHAAIAYELLAPISYLRPALDIPYCHHEKWDGTGYPRGLKGEQIPLAARIFAVVDVWDALRSDRVYRKGWPEDKVRSYLLEQAGKHFDPQVVDAFFSLRMADEKTAGGE